MSEQFATIRVHNSQRLEKTGKRRQIKLNMLTPPKINCSASVFNTYRRYESKLGYDYLDEKTSNSVKLKWIKQEFEDKMNKYLGKGTFVKKATRMDKIRRKEELNFKVEPHPVIRLFEPINLMIEKNLKKYALRRLFQ